MPIGAFKLNSIGRYLAPAAPAGRTAKTVTAITNAKVSTTQSKFAGASLALGPSTADRLHVAGYNIIGTAFTFEGWVRITSFSFGQQFITQDDGSSGGQGCQFKIRTDGKIDFVYWTTSSRASAVTYTTTGTALATNTWYHLAAVWTGSTLTIYKDGTSIGSTSVASMYQSSNSFAIGGFYGSAADPLNGWVDEVRISNIARYTSSFTPSTTPFTNDTNTTLLLHMNGTANSTVFTDDIGSRRSIGWSGIGNAQIDTAQFKFGTASSLFDANGDYLINTTDNDIWSYNANQNFTWEMWWRSPTATPFNAALFNNPGAMMLYVTNDAGNWKYAVWNGVGNNYVVSSALTISANTWYHVAFTRSADTMQLWHNGTQVGTASGLNGAVASSNGALIGMYSNTFYMNGWIDELRISKGIARYTGTFTPSTTAFTNDANTTCLLHFNDTDASTTFTDDNA